MKKNKKADWWEQAVFYLSDNDPIMKNIINNHNEDYLQSRDDPFNALCRTIIGQQISVKAAASIWNKFATGTKNINPKNVIKYGNNNIRKCGISNKKVEYIIGLSNFFIENPDSVNLWKKMDDKSIIKAIDVGVLSKDINPSIYTEYIVNQIRIIATLSDKKVAKSVLNGMVDLIMQPLKNN